MLLIILILLLGLIGMSLPAQDSDSYNVIVCVQKASNTTMQITWHTPPELAEAFCERSVSSWPEGTTDISVIPSNGSIEYRVDLTVTYILQVTCASKGSGLDSPSYRSEELTFHPGDLSNKSVCTKSRHQTNTNNDTFLCAWKPESNTAFSTSVSFLWWWPTRPNITMCNIEYLQRGDRTKTLYNVTANEAVSIVALEAWAICQDQDDLHRIHRSQRVKLKQGFSSPECKFNAVWHGIGHSTVLPTNTPPVVQFHGLNVSSIGKGLVLAFAVIFIAIGIAIFIYRRYKWFLHRRAQRLLRVEDSQEELNSMEEFQRMV